MRLLQAMLSGCVPVLIQARCAGGPRPVSAACQPHQIMYHASSAVPCRRQELWKEGLLETDEGTGCAAPPPPPPPCVLQEHVFHPYETVLPYEEFSIRLSNDDLPQVRARLGSSALHSVPDERGGAFQPAKRPPAQQQQQQQQQQQLRRRR